MAEHYANDLFGTTLAASIDASQTTLAVASAAAHPAPDYRILLDEGTGQDEVCRVTGASGTTLTVVRGDGGSTARAHPSGAKVRVVLTKEALDALLGGGGGGGGGGVLQGDLADRPAAGTAGRVYKPHDAPYEYVDNGTSWDAYLGPLGKVTPPVYAEWNGLNFSGSTSDGSHGAITIQRTVTGAGAIKGLYHAKPGGSSWRAKLAINPFPANVFNTAVGIGFRDSVSGRMLCMNLFGELGTYRFDRMNTFSSFNANVDDGALALMPMPQMWRLWDTGTDLTFEVLTHWQAEQYGGLAYSEPVAAFMLNHPDQVVFYVFDNVGAGSGRQASITLLAYEAG